MTDSVQTYRPLQARPVDIQSVQERHFSPLAMLLLLVLVVHFVLPSRDTVIGAYSVDEWLNGTAAAETEQAIIDESAMLSQLAEAFRGLRYHLFAEGSKGVLVGADNWLFSSEEFVADPIAADRLLAQNTAQVIATVERLNAMGTDVVIALLPDKSRILEHKLIDTAKSDHSKERYNWVRKAMLEAGIYVPDLRPALLRNQTGAFFKTDTHWTPLGSRYAAESISREIEWHYPELTQKADYTERSFVQQSHQGDLAKFVPAIALTGLREGKEVYPEVHIERAEGADVEADLFETRIYDIVLLGTSFSADTRWGFADQLRLGLQNDVENLAVKGDGVLAPMQALIEEEYFDIHQPSLLIWEIPERYLSRINGR